MNNTECVLFEVVMRDTGHRYTIYDSGRIEGFDGDAIIINYHQPLVDQAVAAQILA